VTNPRQRSLERDLAPLLEGDLRTDPVTLALFSTAACIFRRKPLAVVAPRSTADVAAVLAYAHANGVPVTPRGGGSSLCGQALGPGIILDFSAHLNRVLRVEPDARRVTMAPGAIHTRVQKAAAPHGLRLGPDPSSGDFCTIGGTVGTNAAGAHSLRHGATKDHVVGLRLVLYDGTVVALGEGTDAPPLPAGGAPTGDATWRAMEASFSLSWISNSAFAAVSSPSSWIKRVSSAATSFSTSV
jgi:FAD/FMN-containing dehydrogenase